MKSSTYVVLSRASSVHGAVIALGAAGHRYRPARSGEEMLALAGDASALVLDLDDGDSATVLAHLAGAPERAPALVVAVTRDLARDAPPGAHVVVTEPLLRSALAVLGGDHVRAPASDRLLAISVLDGQVDQALEAAATDLAAAFDVERCVIALRGDSTGGATGGAHTWDSLTWSLVAERCRAAAAADATLIAPTGDGARSESYLATAVESPLGSQGFIGLVVERPFVFSPAQRGALRAIAARLGRELGWRAVHQRTADDLDRHGNTAGKDLLLGIWNRHATSELATMQVSASKRTGLPFAVVVIDALDLHRINTRYGLDAGDRLLRRIADAVQNCVRTEDVVGRWAGDKIAVLLHGTAIEGAQRVAERLRAALDARPLELPTGEVVPLSATVGIAALGPNEDTLPLIARALVAAKDARDGGLAIARASTGPAPRFSQIDVGEELRATVGGTYRVLHEISRGGMGVVYRAEDLALERPVAIKMLRPDLAEDRAFVERLRVEAAMLARLQHPNLVQIYSFGQSGGDSYFVMELVEGEGLQQTVDRHRLERTQMPLAELAAIVDEIASALDAIHDRGIVHRDVKPANVIRDPFRNRAVLVDVGIARRYGQFVESAGTPGYVAPEVIASHDATPRSDVYGLAATVYTLLTLTPPWGDDLDALGRQCSGAPITAPSAHRPELAVLDPILRAALAIDPADRPATAGELARAIRRALALDVPAAPDNPRWQGSVVMPRRAIAARTRGVVFRSVARALGVRDSERLRDGIGGTDPDIARALTDTAPLAWLATDVFRRLLAIAPAHVDRDASRLARDIARATVRASFRRFFPASAATLVPERTLSAIRNVWGQYQSWGAVSSMPVNPTESVVRIADGLDDPELCAWAGGMLDQLVVLSGGRTPLVDHETCTTRGDDTCLFRVTWDRSEQRGLDQQR